MDSIDETYAGGKVKRYNHRPAEIKEFQGAYTTTFGMTAYRFVGTAEDHERFRRQREEIYKKCLQAQTFRLTSVTICDTIY